MYDFIQCWTNVEDVGPTLYNCYTKVLCLPGKRTFSQTLYISAMLVQCWASVADVGLTLKQHWVSVRWSSIQSYNQVTSSTTLYCMLKAYTHSSLEPDSIFNDLKLSRYLGIPVNNRFCNFYENCVEDENKFYSVVLCIMVYGKLCSRRRVRLPLILCRITKTPSYSFYLMMIIYSVKMC